LAGSIVEPGQYDLHLAMRKQEASQLNTSGRSPMSRSKLRRRSRRTHSPGNLGRRSLGSLGSLGSHRTRNPGRAARRRELRLCPPCQKGGTSPG
jgi:hypothetical protein